MTIYDQLKTIPNPQASKSLLVKSSSRVKMWSRMNLNSREVFDADRTILKSASLTGKILSQCVTTEQQFLIIMAFLDHLRRIELHDKESPRKA